MRLERHCRTAMLPCTLKTGETLPNCSKMRRGWLSGMYPVALFVVVSCNFHLASASCNPHTLLLLKKRPHLWTCLVRLTMTWHTQTNFFAPWSCLSAPSPPPGEVRNYHGQTYQAGPANSLEAVKIHKGVLTFFWARSWSVAQIAILTGANVPSGGGIHFPCLTHSLSNLPPPNIPPLGCTSNTVTSRN